MVPKTIHEYESTHAAKEHGLTKSATSPIQKVRKILDTTSLSNLTPADVYFGRGETILLERERIKQNTINQRRLQHRKTAA